MRDLNKSTLAEQIYGILREDIINRAILPGEKLTLKSLQERFQVSSTPIRDALTRLTEDSLVIYYSNIGIKVVELTPNDLREIYDFIAHLDSLAINYAFTRNDLSTFLPILEENQKNSKKALKKKNDDDWIYYSENFHLISYDYCGNARLAEAAAKLRGQLTILSNRYERLPECQTQIEAEHDEILEAIKGRDVAKAEALMRQHLHHTLEFALEML